MDINVDNFYLFNQCVNQAITETRYRKYRGDADEMIGWIWLRANKLYKDSTEESMPNNHANTEDSNEEKHNDGAPIMIDLGLPSGLLWASCNLGASKPEEYGKFFAWGETIGHDESSIEKIFSRDCYVANDYNNGQLDAEHDAATVAYGENYRMPTSLECQELIDNTKHKLDSINGVPGMRFIGSNGNSIFIPFAGDFYGTGHFYRGSYFVIWSSTRKDETYSSGLNVDTNNIDGNGNEPYVGIDDIGRFLGFSIRCVSSKQK